MRKLKTPQLMSWVVLVTAALCVVGCAVLQSMSRASQRGVAQVLDLQSHLDALATALQDLDEGFTGGSVAGTGLDGMSWDQLVASCDRQITAIDTHPAGSTSTRDLVDRYRAVRQQLGQRDAVTAAQGDEQEQEGGRPDLSRLLGFLEDSREEQRREATARLGAADRYSFISGLSGWTALALIAVGCGLLILQQRTVERAKEIERQSMLLAAAVRSTDEGILISDLGEGKQSSVVFVNESFCRMVKMREEELVGRPVTLFCDSNLGGTTFTVIEQDLQASKSTRIETMIRRKDGSRFHSDWHMSPVRDETGLVTHFITTIRDISDFKEQQAQLIQSEKMASLGQLASGVAHEINNPIGFAMNELQMLAKDMETFKAYLGYLHEVAAAAGDGKLDVCQEMLSELDQFAEEHQVPVLLEELDEMLASSLEGVERVKEIVRQLKDFARPDDLELVEIDVNEQVEAALRITEHTLKHKCKVTRRYGEPPLVRGHPGQLMQVFTNLLINAEQAIEEEGQISITTGVKSSEVFVSISDTGVGIPPEHLPLLFTPFFTTKGVGEGTGLGLSVSYGIITSLNGTISVESSPGQGTTFTVRLPSLA